MGAAVHWASDAMRGSATRADGGKAAREWNLDEATAQQAWEWLDVERLSHGSTDQFQLELDDGSYAVWPENWKTVMLFWRLRRCWRLVPMFGVAGLDWQQVESRIRMAGVRKAQDMERETSRLELMEDAAMEVINSHGK